MRSIYDHSSYQVSALVTKSYSSSFSLATKLLSPKIRQDIYAIYGFVRYADEIVDTFHDQNQGKLLNQFEEEFHSALDSGLSINPIIHSFVQTFKKYHIEIQLVHAFLRSMKMDLSKKEYSDRDQYEEYIYGSADVVGLMCLKVFVNGSSEQYDKLKMAAMKLGSAFQKVNFLRDLKDDTLILERSYFPQFSGNKIGLSEFTLIVNEIEEDFRLSFEGIKQLPVSSRLGVYTAYRYYLSLLEKIKKSQPEEIFKKRFSISMPKKLYLLCKTTIRHNLNLI